MNFKALFQIVLLFALPVNAVQAEGKIKTLRDIGEHAVHRPPLKTQEDLCTMMQKEGMKEQIFNVLKEAPCPKTNNGRCSELHEAIYRLFPSDCSGFKSDAFRDVRYGKNSVQFSWMLFRSKGEGKLKVAENLEWGGEESLPAFEFTLSANNHAYIFTVPKGCGNLALLKNDCPSCVDCKKDSKFKGYLSYLSSVDKRLMTIEANNNSFYKEYKEGNINITSYVNKINKEVNDMIYTVKNELSVMNNKLIKIENDISSCSSSCPDSKSTTINKSEVYLSSIDKNISGIHNLLLKNYNKLYCNECKSCLRDCRDMNCGDCSPPCIKKPAGIDENGQACPSQCAECKERLCFSSFNFLADLGYFRQSDPADYLFGRFGIEYKPFAQDSSFKDVSLLTMIGVVPRIKGDDGDDAFMLDVIAQYNVPSPDMFIGLGIGGWFTSGDVNHDSADSDLDIIANIGLNVGKHVNMKNSDLAVFFEVRSAVDEIDGLAEYGRFGAGVRFRF